jgi:hypothetical protein
MKCRGKIEVTERRESKPKHILRKTGYWNLLWKRLWNCRKTGNGITVVFVIMSDMETKDPGCYTKQNF